MSRWSADNKPALTTQVIIDPRCNSRHTGRVFTVIKHRVKNVLLKPANGVGKNLIADPGMLLPAPADGAEQVAAVEAVPYYPPVPEGAVVRVAGPGWKQPAEKLYVILADNTHKNNSVKLTELGGTPNGAWWPRVPRGYITVVPLADILK